MPRVAFTQNLQRHVACPPQTVSGDTVAAVLEAVFREHPPLRSYVIDEQGTLRKHMLVFVDGELIRDRVRLSDAVAETSEVYVMQALSGG